MAAGFGSGVAAHQHGGRAGYLGVARPEAYRRGGAPGYDPDMLLTLLIWAWAQGVRSSRVIERLCQRDVAFRIICAGDGPDHVTISRFRAEAAQVMESLFAQVLALCARVGMAHLGVVALDSVKIGSDASLTANHTEAGLRRAAAQQADIDAEKARELAAAALAEHAATESAEDALYGPGVRGDEVPPELVDEPSRAARIAQALAELAPDSAKAARRAAQLEAFRRRRERRRIEPMGLPPAEIRVEILTQNLVEGRARQQAKIDRYHAGGKRGPQAGARRAGLPGHAGPRPRWTGRSPRSKREQRPDGAIRNATSPTRSRGRCRCVVGAGFRAITVRPSPAATG